MAAAAFNDIAAWILLALAIALAGNGGDGPKESPLVSVWVLLSGVVFVAFMMMVISPAMKWVAKRCSPEHDTVDEAYICLTLAGVMVSGFITDLIGIHAIFGAFIFGLAIPKEGHFTERLMERIEDFVSGLLLPLYFASSGLKTDVTKISGAVAWGLLVLVVTAACAGKIVGTFVVAMMCKIPAREAITLGVLMNTKGLVELIVLNIGKEKKVLNDEAFAILVLMALFTTFITTPTVMAIYKPARSGSNHKYRHLESIISGYAEEFRVLACAHGPGNIPSLINFIESTRSTNKTSRLKVYIMHLIELTERSSSIIMVQRLRKNGLPFINRLRRDELHDRIAVAFQAYGQLGQVNIRPTTAISPLASMHDDICHVAKEKMVAMIVLPFHKRWTKINGEDEVESVGHGWRLVNQRVLKEAPCSAVVLVDRGFGSENQKTPGPGTRTVMQNICVIFFGGSDDREALELGGRMAEHPSVKVEVIQFMETGEITGDGARLRPSNSISSEKSHYFTSTITYANPQAEKEKDEKAMAEFKNRCADTVQFTVKMAENVVDEVLVIGRSGDYNLIVVGRAQYPSTVIAVMGMANHQPEHPELGPIGDLLASTGKGIASSVLVVQQHDSSADKEEIPVPRITTGEEGVGRTDQNQTSSSVV